VAGKFLSRLSGDPSPSALVAENGDIDEHYWAQAAAAQADNQYSGGGSEPGRYGDSLSLLTYLEV
jgi:hypothetical protein